MEPKSKRQVILWISGLIGVAVLGFAFLHQLNKADMLAANYEVAQDTIQAGRDRDGLHVASIKSFEVSKAKHLLDMETQDETIKALQEVIRDAEGKLSAAAIVNTQTASSGVTASEIRSGDTIVIGDTVFIYPEYFTSWNEKWDEGTIIANRDTILRDITMRNSLTFTLGKVKNGWFSKPESVVSVKNLNPNTITTGLRSVDVIHQQKQWVVVGGIGYGYTLKTNEISPTVAIIIGRKIISIK